MINTHRLFHSLRSPHQNASLRIIDRALLCRNASSVLPVTSTISRSHFRPASSSSTQSTPSPDLHESQQPEKVHQQSKGNTKLPPRPALAESELTEVFLCGSGPGGQKINKTASAVQLTHLPTGIVLKCQATRSRMQNRKIARQLLAEKIELLEKGHESRLAIKGERKVRKKKSADKKKRRKYRALEEVKNDEAGEAGNEDSK